MTNRSCLTLLALVPLLTPVGCDGDADAPTLDEELESRLTANPIVGAQIEPYHGRWVGPMTQVGGNPTNDYDATIALAPGLCTVSGNDIARAEWDYYNLGLVCTSELNLLGVGVALDGTRTWTFYDNNLTGPCTDGLVDLTETSDPLVMEHTWRDLSGTVDAEGTVTRTGVCGSGGGN